IVVGGNLRCTLKLAGTSYIPNFNNTILFIESLGGDENKVKTYLTQFKQIGAFSNLNGLIIGEFTELQNALGYDAPINILKSIIDINQIPIIQTRELGHDQSSKAIFIGKHQLFI
ncbi:MAG: LD-carboxypeptidase, partial [Clostridium sp.]